MTETLELDYKIIRRGDGKQFVPYVSKAGGGKVLKFAIYDTMSEAENWLSAQKKMPRQKSIDEALS